MNDSAITSIGAFVQTVSIPGHVCRSGNMTPRLLVMGGVDYDDRMIMSERPSGAAPLPSVGLISHGTSSAEGRAVIGELAAAVGEDLYARNLAAEVVLGHVDVQQPDVPTVLSTLGKQAPTVLVPLLLSPGYHVHVDLTESMIEAGAGAEPEGRDIRLAQTLGPDPRLAHVLVERLPALRESDHLVLAAAGSSDERANLACREVADLLAEELSRPVTAAFHAGKGAPLKDIVEQKRGLGGRVVLANYLLAPGFFHDLAVQIVAGSEDVLAPPLLHGRAEVPRPLVELVRDRIVAVL